MSSSSFWFQLYYKEENEPTGQPVEIEPIPRNINALKAVVLPKLDPPELAKVFVYPPGTKQPFSEDKAIDPGEDVPKTASKTPLIVVAPQQQVDGEPLAKRQKDLADLFVSSSWEKAVLELDDLLKPHIGADHSADPTDYVIPKMMRTWKKDEMRQQLCFLRDKIRPRLDNFDAKKAAKREKLVIGIRLGTGYGKTHGLVEAGKILSACPLIYITYNQGQILDRDEKEGRKALLIRLILAVGGAASASSGLFLMSESAEGLFGDRVTIDMLRDVFVSYACEQAGNRDIVIGVDELRSLSVGAAKAVTSELGKVAAGYKEKSKNMCTVLVTSLDWDPFTTNSERSVEIWTPPVADDDTFWYFAQGVRGYEPERVAAVLAAVGGHHMRSIVAARRTLVKDGVAATVRGIYKGMKGRLGLCLGDVLPLSIRHYVRSCIEERDDEHKPDPSLLPYKDASNAIAPIFVLMAFSLRESTSGSIELLPDTQDSPQAEDLPEHPARCHILSLYDSATLFCDASKQLEEMAKAFDFFRQTLSLPVVPANAKVSFPNEGNFKSIEWYRKLVFPSDMKVDTRSLLTQEKELKKTTPPKPKIRKGSQGQKITEAKAEKTDALKKKASEKTDAEKKKASEKTVYTGVKMEFGNYFHPKESNHPWIDRAFVAKAAGSDQRCLVLAQDKVNESDFGKAVRLLNAAARNLALETGINDVLCIANVIGAGPRTTAQSKFEFPYILIRDHEVKDFFSVNFAVPIGFARRRHLLAYGKGEGMKAGGSAGGASAPV